MRELVKLRAPDVTVRPEEIYQFAGVYCFGRGVFKGSRKSGMDFAYPRWPALSGASTGTNVRRRRLNPQDFLDYEMPLPSWKTQMILKEVRAETDALKLLQAETAAELDAMPPSILDRAFDGDL